MVPRKHAPLGRELSEALGLSSRSCVQRLAATQCLAVERKISVRLR
jgi:hypothetical protein